MQAYLLTETLPAIADDWIAIDTETTGSDPHTDRLKLVQLGTAGVVYLLPSNWAAAADVLRSTGLKILQHGKFDAQFLLSVGISVAGPIFDTMLASQVLHCGEEMKHDLGSLALRHLGIAIDKTLQASFLDDVPLTQQQMEYAATDVIVLDPLRRSLERELMLARLDQVARLEFELMPILAQIEWHGIAVNQAKLRMMQIQMRRQMNETEEVIQTAIAPLKSSLFSEQMIRDDINLSNPRALLAVLKAQGVPVKTVKTDDLIAIASKYPSKYPIVWHLLGYRLLDRAIKQLGKIESSIHPITGKLHGKYRQCSRDWGTLSDSRTGVEILHSVAEHFFNPRSGYRLYRLDFGQLELIVLAHLSKCDALRGLERGSIDSAIARGVGVHGLKGVRLARDKASERGILMTDKDVKDRHNQFFEQFPEIKAYHQQLKPTKQVRNLFGRRHRWKFPASASQQCQFLVYSTTSDMLKSAIVLIQRQLGTAGQLVMRIENQLFLESDSLSQSAIEQICQAAVGKSPIAQRGASIDAAIQVNEVENRRV